MCGRTGVLSSLWLKTMKGRGESGTCKGDRVNGRSFS